MTDTTPPLIDADGNEIALGARVAVIPDDPEDASSMHVGTAIAFNYSASCVEVLFLHGAREMIPTGNLLVRGASALAIDLPKKLARFAGQVAEEIVEATGPGGEFAGQMTGMQLAATVAMQVRERAARAIYREQRLAEEAD